MKEFGSEEIIFISPANFVCGGYTVFTLSVHASVCVSVDAFIPADQLLPQLLMEQFDTFTRQNRHIEHMHEGVWLNKK